MAKYLEISNFIAIFVLVLLARSLLCGLLPGIMKLLQIKTTVVAGIAGLILTSLSSASHQTQADDVRELSFYHTHTGKRLNIVYSRNGEYIPSALDEINHFLYDFRTGDEAEMDPELLDLIYEVREALGSDSTYQVVSAYRSPKTNEMLRGRSQNTGVARNSQHLLGKAIDVRLEGVKTTTLRDTAIAMKRGGVGFYAASDFVHMDTGRVRRW